MYIHYMYNIRLNFYLLTKRSILKRRVVFPPADMFELTTCEVIIVNCKLYRGTKSKMHHKQCNLGSNNLFVGYEIAGYGTVSIL